MQQAPRFCTACGGALAEDARFCTGCGAPVATPVEAPAAAPVATPVATPVAAPAQTDERVVSVIPNASLKKGFMGISRTSYVLVFTERRIIFAEVTKDMLKQSVADARDAAKSDGKGFFGQWGAQLGAYSKLAEAYLVLPPDEALAQNPENFAIDKASVEKAKLKSGMVGDADTGSTPDRLVLKTSGGKYDIELGSGIGQAKEALIAAEMI